MHNFSQCWRWVSGRISTVVLGMAFLLGLVCIVSCHQAPRSVTLAVSPASAIEGSGTAPSCCAAGKGGGSVAEPVPTAAAAAPAASPSVTPTVTEMPPRYTRTVESYRIPDVVLVNQAGEKVRLRDVLDGPDPVALNFVFTTCTTICPVMTASFSGLEKALAAEPGKLRLVSISLDPEYDSPKVLRAFAKRYGAASNWEFLTGDARQVTRVYRAFEALTGSKFSHQPFTLFKVPGEKNWLRIEGLTSVADLAYEYRRLVDETGSSPSGG